MLTTCVLLYGDYPHLADRCLSSLEGYIHQIGDLRIGMNACSERTRALVSDFASIYHEVLVESSDENICKYPMMRRLIDAKPLDTYMAWFDDDSFVRDSGWYALVESVLSRGVDMVGAVYKQAFRGGQADWVEDQPWYTGEPVRDGYVPKFCTGGFWVIRSQILLDNNWPPPVLKHRGGDVMLGELLRQQGFQLTNNRLGVAINADAEGRESKSPRRGYDETWLGVNYVRSKSPGT